MLEKQGNLCNRDWHCGDEGSSRVIGGDICLCPFPPGDIALQVAAVRLHGLLAALLLLFFLQA